jgi:hypothetical protein
MPSSLVNMYEQTPSEQTPEADIIRAVGGVVIAGGVGSIIHLTFSSIIIGVYEIL